MTAAEMIKENQDKLKEDILHAIQLFEANTGLKTCRVMCYKTYIPTVCGDVIKQNIEITYEEIK